jgi:hypothetical protein
MKISLPIFNVLTAFDSRDDNKNHNKMLNNMTFKIEKKLSNTIFITLCVMLTQKYDFED